MKHLSALDALFLQLETPDTPMHVGSLMLLDRPPARRDPYAAIRAHIAKRIHLAPVFSRVLRFMPLDIASPLWVPAERVDLDYHIQRVTLPAPGTQAQLEHAVERLHEGTLDRDRPLWQFTVIDGLKSGQVGFYAKIHHAALDGQGGIAVAQALLDAQPKPRAVPRAAAKSAAAMPPSAAKMLGSALRNTVAQYGRILKAIPSVAQAAARTGAVALTAQPKKRGSTSAPRMRLNAAIGAERVFVAAQIPLAEAKAIARHYDAKLNDAVLAICAGALRRHFAKDKATLGKAMVAAVPLSLRAPGDTTQENQVSMMFVGLATQIADPVKAHGRDRRRQRAREAARRRHEGRDSHRSALARHSVADGRDHAALPQGRRCASHPGLRQRRDLQRSGAAGSALPRRRRTEGLLPSINRDSRTRAEHHNRELQRLARYRARGVP